VPVLTPPARADLFVAVEAGDLVEVIRLIAGGADVNVRGEKGYAPLMAAAEGGRADVVSTLLAAGADPEARNDAGQTAGDLAEAEGHKHVIRLLEAVTEIVVTREEASEIEGTVIEASDRQVKIKIDSELVPNFGDKVKISSEHPTAGEGAAEGTWEITHAGEGFVVGVPQGETFKPQSGQRAIVLSDNPRTLPRFKLDKALLEAAKEGNIEQVRQTLQAGADVNAKGIGGSTPLGWAASKGHIDVARALIEARADIHWEARRGQTALNVAAAQGHTEIVKLLIQSGVNVNERIKSTEAPGYYQGATPLFMAARGGHTEAVCTLLQFAADVNAKNKNGENALFYASRTETVRALIDAGADVHVKNRYGATPLMYATESSQVGPLLVLINAGADVNAKTTGDSPRPPSGTTALMAAAGQGNLKAVHLLLIAGADVNGTNAEGQTALDYASKGGHSEIVDLLREPRRSMRLAKRALEQELMEAVEDGDAVTVGDLVRFGVDVNTKDNKGLTALIKAVESGLTDIVQALIDAGADVNAPDREYGATPLMAAASEGHTEIVRTLLQTGADLNIKAAGDEKGEGAGWTALMVAAMGGHIDVVSQLLEAGVDSNAVNRDGKTALEIARKEGNKEVVSLLEAVTKRERKVTILQYKAEDWPKSKTDFARVTDNLVFDVGLGSDPKWGYGFAGVEMSDVRILDVGVQAPTLYQRYDANSFAGFIIDYHSSSGYTKRVVIGIGMMDEGRWDITPNWGKHSRGDLFVSLDRDSSYQLDLRQWAPAGWDGRIWFTVGIQNAGEGNSIRAKLKEISYAGKSHQLKPSVTWDFETGDLMGWETTGEAFTHQPTYGDNPRARGRGQPSKHQGDFWIGGYEKRPRPSDPAGKTQGDGPRGTLISQTFEITQPIMSFLIGGGCDINSVRAELLVDGKVVRKTTGKCTETMKRTRWDVSEFIGRSARIQLVDESSGGWGHINFDDVRFEVPESTQTPKG
jgi:ankyrin repeat protein